MSEILTIANLWHTSSRVWTCTEPEFRLSWMKLCSSDNHYTTDCHSPALLDLLFSSVASICSAKAFPPLGNSDHVVSVSTDFPSNSQWNTLFQWIGYDYSFSDSDNSGAQDLSLENSANFYLCFWLALFLSVFYFFFLYWSPSSSLCTVFDSISPKINEVVSISPYANVFVFGNFNVHQRDWLIYSGKVDRPSELCYNFSISNAQMTVLRWLAFLLGFLTVTLTVLLFWFYIFLLLLLFVQQWLSLYWLGNSDRVVSVSSDFLSNSQWSTLFHCMACDYSCADYDYFPGDTLEIFSYVFDWL